MSIRAPCYVHLVMYDNRKGRRFDWVNNVEVRSLHPLEALRNHSTAWSSHTSSSFVFINKPSKLVMYNLELNKNDFVATATAMTVTERCNILKREKLNDALFCKHQKRNYENRSIICSQVHGDGASSYVTNKTFYWQEYNALYKPHVMLVK